MQTRSSSKFVGESSTNPTSTNPKRRNRRRSKQRVEPFALEKVPIVTMADQRTMAKLLRAPTEGYAEAIVVLPIPAEHFEVKHSLINLVTSKQFFGFEKEDPHAHIRYFIKITSTLKYKDVPEMSIKLMLFPYSIDGPARIWLDKEPPLFILTWDDIDLLRACPHHSFIELHQLDTFFNGLNPSDQDSLNSATGGNLLERSTQDALKIIENKLRNKPTISLVKASNVDSSEMAKLIDAVSQVTNTVATMMKQIQASTPAFVKAVEESCVACGNHDNIQGYVSAAVVNNNYNQGYRPQGDPHFRASNQMGPPGFPLSMFGQFMKMNIASSLGSGSLPSNTIPNPQEDLKAITTRSGATLAGPSVSPPPSKEVNRETESITDQIPNPNLHQPSIPYPSRLNKEKIQGKDDIQIHSFLQMFKKIHFNISFFEALAHMPKFAKMVKDLLMNKEKLIEVANTPVNENGSALILIKLLEKLRDTRRFLIPYKFTFPANFVLVDYEVDPWVPLILGRPFLRDIHFLEKLLNDDPTPDLPPIPHPVCLINDAENIKSSIDDPSDLELKDLPSNLEYAFLEGTSKLPVIIAKYLKGEEKEQLLKEKTTFTCPYGTFAYRRMPFGLCNAPGTFQRCMMVIFHDMIEKTMEVLMDDFSVFGDSFSTCLSHLDTMLQRCKDTNLVLNWKKCHFMVKEGIVLDHKISKNELEVDRAKVDVIVKLPPSTTVKGIRSFLGHADTPFVFSDECLASFKILKKRLTEAPILVSSDWDLPFELMCDASDYAVGAVLGQRKDKYFRHIHYASKTLSDAQTNYTVTKKELLVMVNLLLKFMIKKGAENLAADHLSRLESPYQGDRVGMEINDNFPHESLNMISLNLDNKPLWFADIANYLVGNVLVKRCHPNRKRNSLRIFDIIYGMTPISFGFVLIRLFDCVWTGRKLWTFSKLAIMDPPGDTMA
nr:reverse transcriptase domain-containing protein [Tanacetum cinerariifolium]